MQGGLLDRLAAMNPLPLSEPSLESRVKSKRLWLGAAASVVVLAGEARSLLLMITMIGNCGRL